MNLCEYEKQILMLEASDGGENIELTETNETERQMIAEGLAKMLYKIVLIAISFGIELEMVADISLLQHKSKNGVG